MFNNDIYIYNKLSVSKSETNLMIMIKKIPLLPAYYHLIQHIASSLPKL